MTFDPSALNDVERRALALLARGHTAKTAAAELGVTETAVNERLREARRKTGVGSSRELARLIVAQENGDEEIGMASEDYPKPASSPAGAPHGAAAAWSKGRIAMTSFMLGAAAVAALLLTPMTDGSEQAVAAPPRVVATTPVPGGVVPAGPFVLSVTFDRPMRGNGWSFTGDPAAYPDCASTPTLSRDARTFTLSCRAQAGRDYVVGFNGGRFRNFRSREGVAAEPYELRFTAR